MRTKFASAPAFVALAGVCLLVTPGCGNDVGAGSEGTDAAGLVEYDGVIHYAGHGYDVVKDVPKPPGAVAGKIMFTPQNSIPTLDISYVENSSQLQSLRSSEINVEANGTYLKFSGEGGYAKKTSSDIKITRNSIVFYARQRIALGTYSIELESLTPAGEQALADITTFVNSYGNTYLKSATYAADLVYLYCYEFNELDETKRSEMKAKLKAGIQGMFGLQASYSLTAEDRAKISSLSKTMTAYTNVAGFSIPTVENLDQWRDAQKAFDNYVKAPGNARHLQYVEASFRPYSDIPSPVWAQHPEFKVRLDEALTLRNWQAQWSAHGNQLTDVKDLTTNVALQQESQAALDAVALEIGKIRNYVPGSRPPAAGEFGSIYARWSPFKGFTRTSYGTAVITPEFWLDGNEDVFTGDFDGDTKVDLLVRNRVTHTSALYLSNGNGTFRRVAYTNTGSITPGFWLDGNEDVFTGDYDGDGAADLLVRNRVVHTSGLYLSNRNGTFTRVAYTSTDGITPGFWLDRNEDVFTGDFDGDGARDLLVRNRVVHTSGLYLSNRNGTFRRVAYTSTDGITPGFWLDGNEDVFTGDFDGDGATDLLVRNRVTHTSGLYRSNRNGTFTRVAYTSTDAITLGFWLDGNEDVYAGDFNRDGAADLIVRNRVTHTSGLYLSNANWTFTRVAYTSIDGITPGFWLDGNEDVFVGDFDGDRNSDLIVRNKVAHVSGVFLVKR